MKSTLLTLLCLGAAAGADAKTLRVVTTTPDLAAVAREVGGDKARVERLGPPQANPHFVDAKPSFIVKLMKADLFIQTGLDLEIGWAPLLIQGARRKDMQAGGKAFLDASEAIAPIEVPVNPSRAMGDVHPGGNPHYMADPENARLVARAIAARLSELSPGDKEAFDKNLAGFEKRLDAAMSRWTKVLEPLKGVKIVAYHKEWSYFAKRFGLRVLGELEPKPGIPPTPAHVAALIERMKAEGGKLVFTDAWYERRTPEAVAEAAGAKVLDMALFPGSRPGTDDYISCMDYNVRLVAGQDGAQRAAMSP